VSGRGLPVPTLFVSFDLIMLGKLKFKWVGRRVREFGVCCFSKYENKLLLLSSKWFK